MAAPECVPFGGPVAAIMPGSLGPAFERSRPLKLSVIIPCYNERSTVATLLDQVRAVDHRRHREGDRRRRRLLDRRHPRDPARAGDRAATSRCTCCRATGARARPCREGLRHATGDILLIQDADLEYDPADYPILLRPILTGRTKVVYGSRFLGEHKAMYFWHAVGNQMLTLITNILFDTHPDRHGDLLQGLHPRHRATGCG